MFREGLFFLSLNFLFMYLYETKVEKEWNVLVKKYKKMGKEKSVDQELMRELLEEKNESSWYQKQKEGKPMETKNENLMAENFARKTPPVLESTILSGLGENGISKDFISQTANWVQQHPLETILGAIAIGGFGYMLYQQFAKKPEPESEEALKNRIARARRKRLRERRKTFMEKAKDLFHSENEKGERKFDLGKTVTAVSVTAMGALAGVLTAEKSVPVTLFGAASLALAGYSLNSPLVSLGAIGMAVGALVKELVRKTVKSSVETVNTSTVNPTPEESSSTETNQEAPITSEQVVGELNVEEESKEDFGELEGIIKALREEEVLELA